MDISFLDYLFDGYETYFDLLPTSKLSNYKHRIYTTILSDEQINMFKYMMKRIPLSKEELITRFITDFSGEIYFNQFIEVINEYNPNFNNILLKKEYLNKFILKKNIRFVKSYIEFRKNNGINNNSINCNKLQIKEICDKNVYYWLIENDMLILDILIKKKIIYDYLFLRYADLENLNSILKKFNFTIDDFKNLLIEKINKNEKLILLLELIKKNKIEIIYYLFEIIESDILINKYAVDDIISKVIDIGNYKLFVFIFKKIILLKYSYSNYRIKEKLSFPIFNYYENIAYDNNKIIYELIKLGIEPSKCSKYIDIAKNITIIDY
jgi:hypothetical protein